MRRSRIIQSPNIGFYNLSGNNFAPLLGIDKEALGHLFSSVVESNNAPPICNVLFLYCHVEPDGSVRGSDLGLRDIIHRSGARIAVVASENPFDNCLAAATKAGYKSANIILTNQRNGNSFTSFYQRLFTDMKQGTTMSVAWSKLAPQIPNQVHVDTPDGIMLTEAGHVVFK
jgi:hypothetical protein